MAEDRTNRRALEERYQFCGTCGSGAPSAYPLIDREGHSVFKCIGVRVEYEGASEGKTRNAHDDGLRGSRSPADSKTTNKNDRREMP